jgi:hypothetical protein
MRAVGDAAGGVRLRRPEARDAHARVGHPVHQPAVDLEPADRVDDHVHLHARPRARAQRVGDVVRDLAAPVHVGEQAQGALGARDRVEVAGEDLVAVDQQLDVVAPRDRRRGQRLAGAQEARLADVDRVRAAEVVAVPALAPVAQGLGAVARRERRAQPRRPRIAGYVTSPKPTD